MPRTPLTRLLLLLTIVCAPLPALAAEPDQAAEPAKLPRDILAASQRHDERGAAFYQEGKYVEAHVEFLAAYRLRREPTALRLVPAGTGLGLGGRF